MAVAVFTGRVQNLAPTASRGRRLTLEIPPHYSAMVDSMAGKLGAYEERKGKPAELEVRIEWHYAKRSFDQVKLLFALIGKAAAYGGAQSEDIYESYLEQRGPRIEALISPDAEAAFREKFHRVLLREVRGEWVYLRAIVGASQWTTKQAGEAIDYWMNELAELGVLEESAAELQHDWKQWRQALADAGVDLIDGGADITPEEYKERTPICEGCATWIGTGGELAHIQARGMGGNETGVATTPAGWLHLCTKCHRGIQHQHGWSALLKRAPWLTRKVEACLGKEVSRETIAQAGPV